jgi:hypothetical protein
MKYILVAFLMVSATEAIQKHHKKTLKNALNDKYEPEWGHNSGNSYHNGPTTHFYHGKASPYSVTKEDVQLENSEKYEPEWGHNSGNSYHNGPFTHFYHGKASPYSVVKEDVQTEN